MVPGIIGLAEERFSRLEIAPLLATAESFALLLLAQAMVNSRRDVDSRILAIQSATEVQRSHIVWLMVEHLEDRDWEIVTDLIAQPNVWGMLVISLRGRYATAVRAIETASQLHLSSAERYWSSQFALLLAATVDMAGEEDE